MKKLMLGNQAVARGLYEAGCRFVSSYPGTPSTEITEQAALYDEIYQHGPLRYEIETFFHDGTCEICYYRSK